MSILSLMGGELLSSGRGTDCLVLSLEPEGASYLTGVAMQGGHVVNKSCCH